MSIRFIKWFLGGAAFIVLFSPLVAYVLHFGSLFENPELSNSTGDWADFGTYLSGTVGVIAVIGTLASVLVTLQQQKRMLKHQEEERSKNEAYNIGTIVFPKIRDRLNEHLKTDLATFYKRKGLAVPDSLISPYGNNQILSLFNDSEINVGFETFETLFPKDERRGSDGIMAAFLLRIVESNFKIVEKCINNAPELAGYFYDEELQKAFGCLLAYERACTGGKTNEFYKKCKVAGIHPNVGDNYGIEKMWYKLGEKVIKPAA